jgi:hypothetical protein
MQIDYNMEFNQRRLLNYITNRKAFIWVRECQTKICNGYPRYYGAAYHEAKLGGGLS